MERTELREAFFAEVRNDPYANMVLHHVADAWADGYEQALRDHGLTEERLRKSHRERHQEAVERLTERSSHAQAEVLVALAQVGRLVDMTRPPRR